MECGWNSWRTWDQGWTTTYGYEQGNRFGSRWQVSSDGDYWWAWCLPYYYGSGIYFLVVRVSDGNGCTSETKINHGRTRKHHWQEQDGHGLQSHQG